MRLRWAPAIILGVGAVLTLGADRQRALPLANPLSSVVPGNLHGFVGEDLVLSDAETQVAGVSQYLQRVYERPAADSLEAASLGEPAWFSLYIGYYETQAHGKTIHSPKNCLPGAGWEAISSAPKALNVSGRTVWVNRYVLRNDLQEALALYWYQGRGRVAYDEYRVKLNLFLDAAFRRRSDEALVRIVVPLDGENAAAEAFAASIAEEIIPALDRALPR